MVSMSQLLGVVDVLKFIDDIQSGTKETSEALRQHIANHTWRVSLMAFLLEPYLEQPIDIGRLLKMVIVQELIAAKTADAPGVDTVRNPSEMMLRQQKVISTITDLQEKLGEPLGKEIYALWFEFELNSTFNAKVANALYRLAAQVNDDSDNDTLATDVHVTADPALKMLMDLLESQGAHAVGLGTPRSSTAFG
jgi:putative hydrolase of HD superfamily